MSKIDTQGMSGPVDPNYKGKAKAQPHLPMVIRPTRLHTTEEVKELTILMNEILDAREGRMNYTSYFDTEKFKHFIDEPEPEYKPNKGNSYLRLDEIQE